MVLDTVFDSYRPAVGAISQREKGSLLAHEQGVANPFGIAGKQTSHCIFDDVIVGVRLITTISVHINNYFLMKPHIVVVLS